MHTRVLRCSLSWMNCETANDSLDAGRAQIPRVNNDTTDLRMLIKVFFTSCRISQSRMWFLSACLDVIVPTTWPNYQTEIASNHESFRAVSGVVSTVSCRSVISYLHLAWPWAVKPQSHFCPDRQLTQIRNPYFYLFDRNIQILIFRFSQNIMN